MNICKKNSSMSYININNIIIIYNIINYININLIYYRYL